jgi:DNA-directed RNA polymerase subunit beta'
MMEDLFSLFEKPKNPLNFNAIRISVASPDKIRSWSHGEVKKPETINYRTFKPERDGLFCAKIFGRRKDYECNCGKYKRMRHPRRRLREVRRRGHPVERSGASAWATSTSPRRCAHIWFLKSLPSRIGTLLDMTLKELEKILYFESYVVVDPGSTPLQPRELLSEARYRKAYEEYGDAFRAGMGAEAIRELLQKLEIDRLFVDLRAEMKEATSEARRKKISKRLKGHLRLQELGQSPGVAHPRRWSRSSAGSAAPRAARRRAGSPRRT